MSLRRSAREVKKPEQFNPKSYDVGDKSAGRGGGVVVSAAAPGRRNDSSSASGGGKAGRQRASSVEMMQEFDRDGSDDNEDDSTVNTSMEGSDDSDFDGREHVVFAHKLPKQLGGGRGGGRGGKKKTSAGPSSLKGSSSAAGAKISISNSMQQPSAVDESGPLSSSSAARSKSGAARSFVDTSSVLFNAVQSDSSEVDFISITNDWIRRFHADRVAAMCELVNFVLFMSGAPTEVIDNDVDLDALESDEILELLSHFIKQLSDDNDDQFKYPLDEWVKKGRNPVSMRQRYIAFWMDFGNRLVSQVTKSTKSQRGSDLEILHIIIDLLISFSSLIIQRVRDSVTEAILTLCTVLVSFQNELNERIVTLEKQAGTMHGSQETGGSGGKKGKTTAKDANTADSSKLAMVEAQLTHFERILEEVRDILDTAFQSVFLHRYIDSNVNIRKMCSTKLSDWICCDPPFYYKNEYLKYFGLQLTDSSPDVRIQSIRCIAKFATGLTKYSDVLSDFVERFTGRLIEIAAGDIDVNCQLEMILLLKILQQTGMIDIWPEESLDKVDSVVFDGSASLRVRREALSFFMDHTQGFEALEDEDEDAMKTNVASKSKISQSAAGGGGGGKDSKSMAMKKKKNAFQIETLLEFAECHVNPSFMTKVELLANACLDIPDYQLLYDWQTILSLLLKETDDVITTALQPFQVAMLLILFRRGVESIRLKMDKDESQGVSAGADVAKKQSKKGGSKFSVDIMRQWELLNSLLSRDMNKLLTRFRDSTGNLSNLLGILIKLDIPTNATQFRLILKSLEDLFLISCDAVLLKQIADIFIYWKSISAHPGNDVTNAVTRIVHSSLKNVGVVVDMCDKVGTDSENDSSSGASPEVKSKIVRKTSSSKDLNSEEDSMMSCALSFLRLRTIWSQLNCSLFLPEKFKSFDSIIIKLTTYLITKLVSEFADSKVKSILTILRESSTLMYLFVIFEASNLKRVCLMTEQLTPDLEGLATKVVTLRDQFVNCASQIMEIDNDFSAKNQLIFREMQREIFDEFCKIQIIFCYQPHFSLVCEKEGFLMKPSKNMLIKIKGVFDREVLLLREELESCSPDSDENRAYINERSEILVSKLFKPLMTSMFNTAPEEGFNKRQAASILVHISIAAEPVTLFMKDFVKLIKDWGPDHFFETQLATLKTLYFEGIVPQLKILSDYEEIDEADATIQDILEILDTEFNNLLAVAKKLSSSVCFGKAKGECLTSLNSFFAKAIELALKDKLNLAFFDVLSEFAKLLPAGNLAAQKQAVIRALSESPASDWINELIEQYNTGILTPLKNFCLQFVPELDNEIMVVDLRFGSSFKKVKSKQVKDTGKGKKRKADTLKAPASSSSSSSSSKANALLSSPFYSRTAPPLHITKGKTSAITTFGSNSNSYSNSNSRNSNSNSSSHAQDDYFEEQNSKRSKAVIQKSGSSNSSSSGGSGGGGGSNDNGFISIDKENFTKGTASKAIHVQNQKKTNTFHLGLELEDIDETSSNGNDRDEIEEDDDNDDFENDGSSSPMIINDLDQEEDEDFDVNELFRNLPPRTRAGVKY